MARRLLLRPADVDEAGRRAGGAGQHYRDRCVWEPGVQLRAELDAAESQRVEAGRVYGPERVGPRWHMPDGRRGVSGGSALYMGISLRRESGESRQMEMWRTVGG